MSSTVLVRAHFIRHHCIYLTSDALQTDVCRVYAHDAFQKPAPRATRAWDDGHMESWPDPCICETDKFKSWDEGYSMMGM